MTIGTWSGADPGFPVGGGANLRHRRFSVKTYVKMKEFGPVGGGARRKLLYVDPPLLVVQSQKRDCC